MPPGAIADYLIQIGFVGRKDQVDLEGFHGSRADYYEPFKKYLMDGHTCNTSPHKHFSTQANDVVKQLRMRRVEKVIMAGPVANLCLEGHMRDLIESGFEVAMVSDAVAAGVNDVGDGYEAAMTNWRFMCNAVWTTEEAIEKMKAAATYDVDRHHGLPSLTPGHRRPVAAAQLADAPAFRRKCEVFRCLQIAKSLS